ncbi:MAG: beta-lactamase family protein [Candidatus Gastranaerophilales bacterium]|nr:beta-lactamase family protein [Candidatus Gastranaerophilales bacterium]
MFAWESGRPEEYHIPQAEVEKFEKLLKEQRIHIHGYLLLGGRKILAERYYEPYGREDNHRMYSITKSFVALAVGLLVKNSLVKLDDRICDYFPEKLPEGGPHPWCAEMTIREMLSMRTCHSKTTYKENVKNDWAETFFHVKPDHVSGTVFSYDTSSAHVLGALVEKLTGMKLLDYLRREAFDKVGFSKGAYLMQDPVDVSQGGSGMMSTLRDIAGVAYLCNHFGTLDGEELLPYDFMREALSNLVPTDLQPNLDEQAGYGYFFWMPRTRPDTPGAEDGFVMYGMGGQLAVCFPKFDFCYLTMADTIGNPAGLQILYDCFYHTIYPYLEERPGDNPVAFQDTGAKWSGADGSDVLQAKKGVERYCFFENASGWDEIAFDFSRMGEKTLDISLYYVKDGQREELSLSCSVGDFKRRESQIGGFDCECRALIKNGHLIVESFLVDEVHGNVRMDFAWKDQKVFGVRMVATNEPCLSAFKGFASAERVG